ncbi:hypothetical protein AB0Q95_13085 [Streptomyces sp. NPDC059900]|uniref:hypothetical protein n=1 Tax=Streptomyces sp. NPDC059900 TaxID=3155816 RepID=UPI00341C3423
MGSERPLRRCSHRQRGAGQAGFSKYEDLAALSARQHVCYCTVVFDEFEGRGLPGILARNALNTSVQARRRIVACPDVKK